MFLVTFPLTFPRVPQPVSNGLTAISRANCLSAASFRTADVHLFGTGYPRSGQGFGVCFFAYFLSHKQREVRGRAGAQPRGLDWFFLVAKVKDNTGGSRAAKRHPFVRQQKDAKVPFS